MEESNIRMPILVKDRVRSGWMGSVVAGMNTVCLTVHITHGEATIAAIQKTLE